MTSCTWPTERIKLLYIEDDEVDRMSVMRALHATENSRLVDVEHVSDTYSALDALQRHTFDCVLLDFQLPDGNAFSLLDEWKSSGLIRIPVVILTSLNEESVALDALHKGVQDYIIKGNIPGDLLLRSIRYAIERFRVQSQLEKANEKLEHLAFLDPLTEILNRRGLEHILLLDLERASRYSQPLHAVIVDCDNFKKINDTFGHDIGDLFLKEISHRIRGAARSMDHVGRIGGDEFLILLPSDHSDEAIRFAERVRQAVAERPIKIKEHTMQQTISLGVCPVPAETHSITDLLAHADIALRKSKLAGKNRVSEQC